MKTFILGKAVQFYLFLGQWNMLVARGVMPSDKGSFKRYETLRVVKNFKITTVSTVLWGEGDKKVAKKHYETFEWRF